jgi:hypothetical protein
VKKRRWPWSTSWGATGPAQRYYRRVHVHAVRAVEPAYHRCAGDKRDGGGIQETEHLELLVSCSATAIALRLGPEPDRDRTA